tara:strand:+ start:205 stop:429 length:225 start_codon:yes stop_codon:yes gene_type:complete
MGDLKVNLNAEITESELCKIAKREFVEKSKSVSLASFHVDYLFFEDLIDMKDHDYIKEVLRKAYKKAKENEKHS